ncbi:glycerate kinase [Nocardia sp. 2]|uniref:Glycerate kinase n=1 Tax=Nocardia acididurans TaxID=2802282 RepID=A0ABS1M1N9_9NOCA|nr:glycerate kinase [Nocardia acididurans]MBL1073043.1 glycerate kinase [Nocardia acididurans]
MTAAQPRRVILAPDKFKGSLTAAQVAAALAAGITRAAPGTEVRQLPVADGGDGTVDAFLAAGWERVEVAAVGPTLAPVTTAYAVRGDTAVIELAAVVGLVKLPGGQPDPLHACTYGLGTVIAHALDRGIRAIVLGLGGSASTDGGAGLLQALGLRIYDADGGELGRAIPGSGEFACGGADLADAARIDRTGLHPALAETTFTLASDVDNPLLGPEGAAAVYAPQKGATPGDIATLEAALKNWAALIGPEWADEPGAGAAGGTGFGAMAVLGAVERSGIDVVLDLVGFPAQLAGADLVVTGEGSMDTQSLNGKAPMGVAAAAHDAGIPVVAVVGRLQLTPEQLHAAGFAGAYALADLEPDPARSIADAATLLERIGEQLPTRF